MYYFFTASRKTSPFLFSLYNAASAISLFSKFFEGVWGNFSFKKVSPQNASSVFFRDAKYLAEKGGENRRGTNQNDFHKKTPF